MKSSLLANACAALLFATPTASQSAPTGDPTNELTLAGMRPGRSTLSDAEKRFGTKHRDTPESAGDILLWADPCTGQSLRVETSDDGRIQSVTISSLGPKSAGCKPNDRKNPLPRGAQLVTGRGLRLGQSKARALELYGEPGSTLPSTLQGKEFELLYYAFDWAGSDVPQVMEVTCDRETRRVRKITLAYPSL